MSDTYRVVLNLTLDDCKIIFQKLSNLFNDVTPFGRSKSTASSGTIQILIRSINLIYKILDLNSYRLSIEATDFLEIEKAIEELRPLLE